MSETIRANELPSRVGQELEPSSWLEITQERVNQFADATNDHQFIHIDEEKAAKTPFRGTIAHGYLTLSLVPFLTDENSLNIEGAVMGINYGSDKVRFIQPVKVGSRIRARQVLKAAVERSPGQWMIRIEVTIEIEGREKPAMIAETIAIIIVK